MRPIGGESGQKKRWLERDQTLGEAGVDMHVLRCEARPRLLLLIDEESGDRTIEVMEHDLASKVVSRVGGGGGNHQLFRKGRPDLPVFGWATLSEQGIPPGVPLLVKKQQGFPAAYATSLNAPFLSDDKHAEEDLHWENKAPSNDGSRLLEAASLNALVVLMTGGGSVHQIQMILLTLASFTSSAQVVRLLIQRGRGADSSVIIRVLKVMKQWLDVDHFLEDQIVSAIVTFLDRDVPTDLKAPQQTLRNALLRWARGDTRMYKIRDPPPPPLVAGSKQMRLRDWDPLEVARQITLPVFAVYSRIEARELFSQPWNSPKTQHRCPNVSADRKHLYFFFSFFFCLLGHENDFQLQPFGSVCGNFDCFEWNSSSPCKNDQSLARNCSGSSAASELSFSFSHCVWAWKCVCVAS